MGVYRYLPGGTLDGLRPTSEWQVITLATYRPRTLTKLLKPGLDLGLLDQVSPFSGCSEFPLAIGKPSRSEPPTSSAFRLHAGSEGRLDLNLSRSRHHLAQLGIRDPGGTLYRYAELRRRSHCC